MRHRPPPAKPTSQPDAAVTPASAAAVGAPNPAEVRAWARAHGYNICELGALPRIILTAYHQQAIAQPGQQQPAADAEQDPHDER